MSLMMLDSRGQYFQFSQYNFTPLRVNPALTGASDFASVSLLYRNQGTDGGFHLTSNSLNALYPLMGKRNGQRFGGIGLNFTDDRSGHSGIFSRQEASLAYAVNISVSKTQSLSLGVRALFQTTRIDLDGLYTGLQYVPDRGFSESLSSGEGLSVVKNSFMTFSAGLHWQKIDRKDERLMHVGISFYDLNKPDNAFMNAADHLPTTVVGSGGFRLYRKGNVSVNPDLLVTYNPASTFINGGVTTRYFLATRKDKDAAVDLITRYARGRLGILGLQFHQHNFTMGISYDFPVVRDNVANTGTLEVGIELHQLMKPKKKSKIISQKKKPPVQKNMKASAVILAQPVDSLNVEPSREPDMSDRLRHKQDSIREFAVAGEVAHEPLVLEKATLHVKFEFNSTALDSASQQYFDDLALALIDNPELKIQLVGHTDNVGTDRYNLRLSYHRAQAIKDYLIEKGVEEHRIAVIGKGLREPLNGNATDAERALNRRVVISILYQN
jgi:type IX secretion system PorP/SprF family membrane protein